MTHRVHVRPRTWTQHLRNEITTLRIYASQTNGHLGLSVDLRWEWLDLDPGRFWQEWEAEAPLKQTKRCRLVADLEDNGSACVQLTAATPVNGKT